MESIVVLTLIFDLIFFRKQTAHKENESYAVGWNDLIAMESGKLFRTR